MARKLFIWFWMLSKRLFKKPSFLVILLLIPAVIFFYGKAAQDESGVMTVVLTQEDSTEPISCEIIDTLVGSSPLIRYKYMDSIVDAEEQVRVGGADAAWIFPAQMEEKIQSFITSKVAPEPIVRVITRENNVAIMLSSEKLSGVLYKYCARAYYLHYMREKTDAELNYSDEEILQFYDEALIGDQLFSFSSTGSESEVENNYLLTPMRGLLGVIIALCGLATAMYYEQDNEKGTFSYLPAEKKVLAEVSYQLVSAIDISAVAMICLAVLGACSHVGKELLTMILYIICVVSFSMLTRVIFGGLRGIGTAMVLLVVLMIAICPVFYDFAVLRAAQLFFPPTYYVNAVFNVDYMILMPIYSIICLMLTALIRWIFKRY